jgi:hypothetical protein
MNPPGNKRWGISEVGLSKTVLPNEYVSFDFEIKAPDLPGTYPFEWMLVDDKGREFGQICDKIITVEEPQCTAEIHVYLDPDKQTGGQPVTFNVELDSFCEGKLAELKMDSCDNPTADFCVLDDLGKCHISTAAPLEEGTYNYSVCVDKNGNRIYDDGESKSVLLQVESSCSPITEVCDDFADNDCDGLADCFDPDCRGQWGSKGFCCQDNTDCDTNPNYEDSCDDTAPGNEYGGGSCSAKNGYCLNNVCQLYETSGTDYCSGTPDYPEVTYYECEDTDSNGVDDTCVAHQTREEDQVISGTHDCEAVDWYCFGNILSSKTTYGDKTCTNGKQGIINFVVISTDGGYLPDTCEEVVEECEGTTPSCYCEGNVCVGCSDPNPDDCCDVACDSFQCINRSNSAYCDSGYLCTDQCQCIQISWPDLVIIDIWNTSDGIIHYTIKNEGSADAGQSNTSLEIYEEGVWMEVDSDIVGGLNSGVSSDEDFGNFNLNTYCEDHPGEEVNLRVCTDIKNEVDEASEDNNCLSKQFTCPLPPPPPEPCLLDITSATPPPSLPNYVRLGRWANTTVIVERLDTGTQACYGLVECEYEDQNENTYIVSYCDSEPIATGETRTFNVGLIANQEFRWWVHSCFVRNSSSNDCSNPVANDEYAIEQYFINALCSKCPPFGWCDLKDSWSRSDLGFDEYYDAYGKGDEYFRAPELGTGSTITITISPSSGTLDLCVEGDGPDCSGISDPATCDCYVTDITPGNPKSCTIESSDWAYIRVINQSTPAIYDISIEGGAEVTSAVKEVSEVPIVTTTTTTTTTPAWTQVQLGVVRLFKTLFGLT